MCAVSLMRFCASSALKLRRNGACPGGLTAFAFALGLATLLPWCLLDGPHVGVRGLLVEPRCCARAVRRIRC